MKPKEILKEEPKKVSMNTFDIQLSSLASTFIIFAVPVAAQAALEEQLLEWSFQVRMHFYHGQLLSVAKIQ